MKAASCRQFPAKLAAGHRRDEAALWRAAKAESRVTGSQDGCRHDPKRNFQAGYWRRFCRPGRRWWEQIHDG